MKISCLSSDVERCFQTDMQPDSFSEADRINVVTDVVDINYVPDRMRILDTVNSTDVSVSLIDVLGFRKIPCSFPC